MKIKTPKSNNVLEWNNNFAAARNTQLSAAQRFVDSTCIRYMDPYTPAQNLVLTKSATIGTVIGSGEIHQIAPYARYQYYGMLMVSSVTGSSFASRGEKKVLTDTPLRYSGARHPQAGKLWFERMKADKQEAILQGAAKILGAKAK